MAIAAIACAAVWFAVSALGIGQGNATGGNQPSTESLLDRYASGSIDAIAGDLESVEDDRAFVSGFARRAEAWIVRDPATSSRRRQIAATLTLEITYVKLTTRWGVFRELLNWSAEELRKEPPSTFERTWLLASAALAGRARDRGWLKAGRYDEHALRRHPNDPHLQLAFATALTITGTSAMSGAPLRPPDTSELHRLLGEPVVGAEAAIRLAHVELQKGSFENALQHARSGAQRTEEPSAVYTARFIAGRSLARLGRHHEAEREYAAALQAVPNAQSASLALADLLMVAGHRDRALPLIESSLNNRHTEDDPWRLLAYGEFKSWPRLIGELRREIR